MRKVQFVTYLTPLEKSAIQQSAARRQLTAGEWSRKVLLLHAIDKDVSDLTTTVVEPKDEPTPPAPLFTTIDDDELG